MKMSIRLVAFDCFDTLFHRDCHPEVVLFSWAREMSSFLKFVVIPETLYRYRKNCEDEMKQRAEDIRYEELLNVLYEKLKNEIQMESSLEDFIATSYLIERNIEMQHLIKDEKNISLLKNQSIQGNKVIIITDFYLPKKFFEYIFSQFGIIDYISDIFVSSEIGKRKSTGTIYKYILEYYDITPDCITMIGDNKLSDNKIPHKLGLRIEFSPYINKRRVNDYKSLKKKIMTATKSKEGEYFNGYVGALYLFCERLYAMAVKENVKILMFCSREGQNLKRLFDIYQKRLYPQHLINTKYLYVSRSSTLLPSLTEVSDEKFERIFRQYHEIVINDFLQSIGFSENEIIYLEKSGIDCRKIIKRNDEYLNTLYNNKIFLSLYNKKRIQQRDLFQSYIYKLNEDNIQKLFLVDIGWKGTIQDNIYEILQGKTEIVGFYFGLFKHSVNIQNKKIGVLFDENSKSNYYNIFTYNYVDLEKVFAADHGQTLRYTNKDKTIRPVLSTKPEDLEIYRFTYVWQNRMNELFACLCEEFENSIQSGENMIKIITKSYLREQCVYRPKYYKIYLEFREKVKENFGNLSGRKDLADSTTIRDKGIKKSYLYIDYSYRIFDRMHLHILSPLAELYCYFVYFVKKIT